MKNLILRNTPALADMFILRTIESADGKNTYEVFCEDGKIVICGDCKVSQAMGYYAYLKEYCGANLSHCGNTKLSITSAPLFEGKLSKVIPQKKRAFMGFGTMGYSCAFWGWEKWEREIDLMAMNGINLSLCTVGSEAVWYYTMRDFTYSETGALQYISGPAFWFKQLSGNISSYFSLTDVKYIESRVELGKKIIEREVELGITPIQTGFTGVVPRSLSKLFKKIRMSMASPWCNFPVTYQLDPEDPVFKKFGTALLEKQKQLFGSYHYYACDPFYDTIPAVRRKNYFWVMGRAIDTMLQDFDPDSVWVMQSTAIRSQIAKSVPIGRLLVLDISGNIHEKAEEFWGHDFILGSAMNHGNHNALQGSIKELADNAYASLNIQNCVGTGIFAEGIDHNPIYMDFALEMLTESGKVDVDKWIENYAFRRYGSDENCLVNALKLLMESCYSENSLGKEYGSIICARPSTALAHTAPNDTLEYTYNNKDLYKAAKFMLLATKADKEAYRYDVCDITRQIMSNYCNYLYLAAMKSFNDRELSVFERAINAFLKICDELDELLQSVPELTLSQHLKEAAAIAKNDKDKENFELNLLTQLTLWGPIADTMNYDYAWKEWGGMIGTYYSKRWQSFFERLALQFPKRMNFSTETRKQINGRNAYKGNRFYESYAEFERKWLQTVNPDAPTDKNTVELADNILKEYDKAING